MHATQRVRVICSTLTIGDPRAASFTSVPRRARLIARYVTARQPKLSRLAMWGALARALPEPRVSPGVGQVTGFSDWALRWGTKLWGTKVTTFGVPEPVIQVYTHPGKHASS